MRKLFVSPHNDDAVLFGAFTLMSERPAVLTVFDSYVQPGRGFLMCSAELRRGEDIAAIGLLGLPVNFAGVRDDLPIESARVAVYWALRAVPSVDEVWLPAVEEDGHAQHNLVGEVGLDVFRGARVHRYLTYTEQGKSVGGRRVECSGGMIRRKLQALVCYRTQFEPGLGCGEHFVRDQNEYVLD